MKLTHRIANIRPDRQMLRTVLRLLVVGMGLAVFIKTAGLFLQGRSIAKTTAQSVQRLESQDAKSKEYLEASAKAVQKLQEKGIFCPEKKKPSPQVEGILGDRVLLNGKWCKEGDEHAGFKVIKIDTTEVTLLVDGKETKLAPMLASRPDSAETKPKTETKTVNAVVKKETGQSADESPAAQPVQDDPLAWVGMDMSDGARNFLLRLLEIMPADKLEEAKQEWTGLSEDQKNARLNELQQLVDSGQAEMVIEQLKASQD